MKRSLSVLVLLLAAWSAYADPPAVTFPSEVRPSGQYVVFTPMPAGEAKEVAYVGLSGVEPLPSTVLKDPTQFVLDTRGLKEGRYGFAAVASSETGELLRAQFTVIIGAPAPSPDPDVDPTPPEPKPDPAPIDLPGLRLLIVYESGQQLESGHHLILFSEKVRQFLDANTVAGTDGRTKDYRIFDKDVDTSGAEPHWKTAMERYKSKSGGQVPWLIVSNGKTGYEGPLPETPDEFIELVSKYK